MSSLLLADPLFGEEATTGMPAIILAIDFASGPPILLYADSEGYLHAGGVEAVRIDLRWDAKRGWYDPSPPVAATKPEVVQDG